jgi:hypothetical protein
MVPICNPSYMGSRGRRIVVLRLALGGKKE